MTRTYLSSDLPILFHLEPETGRLQSAQDPQAAAASLSDLLALLHPEDRAALTEAVAQAGHGAREMFQIPVRLARPTGRILPVLIFGKRVEGAATYLCAITDDSAQASLTERFDLAAEATKDVIFLLDFDTGTHWWSPAFTRAFGHQPLAGPDPVTDWFALVHPGDKTRIRDSHGRARNSGAEEWQDEYRILKADGSYARVIDHARFLRRSDGTVARSISTLTDVTRQRDEEARLRAVVEVAANAVYEYDVSAGTFFYSEGMGKTFGHDWFGPTPALTLWQSLLHPDERDSISAEFLRFLASRERYARLEYRFARGDGTWARVRERMIALRDEAGTALRVIGGIEDVTAELDAAERLRQSQKLEAIGKLTGGVAHDFNNLLTVIIGSAGLLEADPALQEDHRALARSVVYAARRGAELTSGLLSFARQQPLSPRPLDMIAVFAEMDSLLRRTLPAYVSLRTASPADLWLVEADPAQLNAALLNLAVNAADAMPLGGQITMESCNWVIDQGYCETDPEARPGEFLRIDITDTGHGMPQEVASRAFDPFFTTKPLGKGSGLGLSMVWGFAKQSGGHARIYTEPGIGTTVTMFLPRSRKAAPDAEAPVSRDLAYGRGQHILVVEDDPMLRRFVVALCERLGYRVNQAEHGDHALEILKANPDIELLFSDVVMPGNMSGKELAERALQDYPGLLVLFTSGYSENAIIHNGRLDEGVHFLAKPYQLRDLGEKLRAVFAQTPRSVVRRQARPVA